MTCCPHCYQEKSATLLAWNAIVGKSICVDCECKLINAELFGIEQSMREQKRLREGGPLQ